MSAEKNDPGLWLESKKTEFVEDIATLIRIPSVSVETSDKNAPFGEPCKKVLEEAVDICKKMGFEGEIHEGYCASFLWKGDIEAEIGIFSHLDVVPEGTGWSYEPYQGIVEDGYLIGRGSGDNKGPAMAALYALRYLKENGWNPRHSIRMFFGANEECGMKDITYYTEHNPMPAFSFTPDASFPVCHGEKGVLEIDCSFSLADTNITEFCAGVASNAVPADAYVIMNNTCGNVRASLNGIGLEEGRDYRAEEHESGCRISVKGIAAHAAFPEGSDSAEVKLASILKASGLLSGNGLHLAEAITALFHDYYGAGLSVPYEDEVSGKLTHVGGMARTEGGKMIQTINIRYPVTTDRQKMIDTITRTLSEWGFEVETVSDNPPCYVRADTLEIKKLTEICNRYLEMDLKPYVMGGGTYARKLKNAVGYGPGISSAPSRFGPDRGKGHQPDECMSIALLEKAVCIYAEAIVALDELVSV